jgi:predicted DNA-binding transcriptional regulator AlpA
MTAAELHAWRKRMNGRTGGYTSWDAVAEALGLSRRTIYRYQRGEDTIPRIVELALRGLDARAGGQRKGGIDG